MALRLWFCAIIYSMNGNETGQRRISAREMTEEIERATNAELEEKKDALGAQMTGFDRARAGVIGSAVLAGNQENVGTVLSGENSNTAELNTERVEQMVTTENALGEKEKVEAAPVMTTLPMTVQIQGKVDKMAVRNLEALVSREGNTPGKLNDEVNRLRREYIANWRAQG